MYDSRDLAVCAHARLLRSTAVSRRVRVVSQLRRACANVQAELWRRRTGTLPQCRLMRVAESVTTFASAPAAANLLGEYRAQRSPAPQRGDDRVDALRDAMELPQLPRGRALAPLDPLVHPVTSRREATEFVEQVFVPG
jgi:hypothetical protein